MDLVQVKGDKVFCDSSLVAKKFKMKHNDVVKVINRLAIRLRGANVTPNISAIEKEYRGQKFTAYLMDREFFTLLGMRFETPSAIEWQIKFNNAFYAMENSLTENQSVMEKCNSVIKLLQQDKDVASVCGKGLSDWKKQKVEHMTKVKELKDEAQLLLGFEE